MEKTQDGRFIYYRYSDPDFSIDKSPLNELELTQLREALAVLAQFKGMPQFDWMEEVLAKLQQDIRPSTQKAILSFDSNQYLRGIEWLGPLYNAIAYQKPVQLAYQPFGAEQPRSSQFHAYHLKQYNSRWFVFGHSEKSGLPLSTLALDRIVDLSEANGDFIINSAIDFDTYFDDIVGVTKPVGIGPEEIILSVASERAGYIDTKPLHSSQKRIRKNEPGYFISLYAIPNRELVQLLLSFGHHVKVLSPTSLAKELRDELDAALKNYNEIVTPDGHF